MMMRMRRGILVLGFGIAIVGMANAGIEEPIDLEKVPAKIMEIARENFKGLKIADVSEVRLDDETVDDDSIIVSYQDLVRSRLSAPTPRPRRTARLSTKSRAFSRTDAGSRSTSIQTVMFLKLKRNSGSRTCRVQF